MTETPDDTPTRASEAADIYSAIAFLQRALQRVHDPPTESFYVTMATEVRDGPTLTSGAYNAAHSPVAELLEQAHVEQQERAMQYPAIAETVHEAIRQLQRDARQLDR
jgi:hypothetical protein